MPAFTHLCEQVNISIFADTITVYLKAVPSKSSFPLSPAYYPAATYFFRFCANELQHKGNVFRGDPEHNNYHQNSFSLNDTHYHLRYAKNIDEPLLKSVLDVFVKHNVLTHEEQTSFLEAFRKIGVDLLLLNQLAAIKEKADQFKILATKNAKYIAPGNAAIKLFQDLSSAINQYSKEPKNMEAYNQLQRNCTKAINDAKPTLEQHRGWKRILGNVGLAIAGLGVFYVVAGLINLKVNNSFLFFNKTDSAEKINKIEEILRNHPAHAA